MKLLLDTGVVANNQLVPFVRGIRICLERNSKIQVQGYAVTWHQLLSLLQPLLMADDRALRKLLSQDGAQGPLQLVLQPLKHRCIPVHFCSQVRADANLCSALKPILAG